LGAAKDLNFLPAQIVRRPICPFETMTGRTMIHARAAAVADACRRTRIDGGAAWRSMQLDRFSRRGTRHGIAAAPSPAPMSLMAAI
jgi:hypothetical protein